MREKSKATRREARIQGDLPAWEQIPLRKERAVPLPAA